MSRWVLVDDSDSGIQYTGSWFQDHGSQNSLGNFGPPYQSTLHGINSAGSFSYSFHGSKVLITGTVQFPDASATNPSWECSVDGVSTPSIPYSDAENRLRLCEVDGLVDTPHSITVKVTVSDQHTFWFDYIQYLPYASASLDNAALSIDSSDSQFQYGGSWQSFYPGQVTSQTGSTFTFDFSGVSLTWLGFYDKTFPMTPTTATYSVDGQTAVPFDLNGSPANASGVQYNQIFFQTSQLAPGDHKLQVVYQGNSQTTPLSIYILQVQNGQSAPTGTTGTSPPNGSVQTNGSITTISPTSSGTGAPTITDSAGSVITSNSGRPQLGLTSLGSPAVVTSGPDSTGNKSSVNIGAIVGGAIGGLALLFLLIFACILLRWRKRRSKTNSDMVDPFTDASVPATASRFDLHDHFASGTASLSHHHLNLTDAGSNDQYTSTNTQETFGQPSMTTFRSEKSSLPRSPERPSPSPQAYPRFQPNRPVINEPQKGFEPSGFAPLVQQKTLTSSPTSTDPEYSPVPRDEDSGVRFGPAAEVLPPRYTFR